MRPLVPRRHPLRRFSRAATKSATFWTRRFYGSSDGVPASGFDGRGFERDFPPLHCIDTVRAQVMLSGSMPFYGRDKAEVYRNTCSGKSHRPRRKSDRFEKIRSRPSSPRPVISAAAFVTEEDLRGNDKTPRRYDIAGPEWKLVSADAASLVRKLLVVDPVRRAAPVDVFAHPWMAKDHVVNTIHLPHFSKNIRRYKLKRKLKAAVVRAPRRTSRGRRGRRSPRPGRGDVTARRPPLAAVPPRAPRVRTAPRRSRSPPSTGSSPSSARSTPSATTRRRSASRGSTRNPRSSRRSVPRTRPDRRTRAWPRVTRKRVFGMEPWGSSTSLNKSSVESLV